MTIELEADQRHAHLLVKALGLQSAKTAETPRVKHTEEVYLDALASPTLSAADSTLYRSCVMRANYLGQDRMDIQEAVKCLSQHMVAPTDFDMTELKRLARFVKKFPRAVLVFKRQRLAKCLDAWGDSDNAGDAVTRRSTSGLVLQIGEHTIKTAAHLQCLIGLSSGEAEFYACVSACRAALHLQTILQGWGLELSCQIVLRTDSSAALGFVNRRGLGKLMKHISTKYLWVQELIARKGAVIRKVGTKDQLADILTKASTSTAVAAAMLGTGLEYRAGRADKQKEDLAG